jgi:hypothetical protein
MIEFTNTLVIDRPAREVYDYLADLENTPDWNWAIAETSRVTGGRSEVGARFRQVRTVPRPDVEMLELTGLDPHTRIEVQGTLARMAATLEYTLTPTDQGTVLANHVLLEPKGMARVVGTALSGRVKASVAENLGELKSLLEGGPRAEPAYGGWGLVM